MCVCLLFVVHNVRRRRACESFGWFSINELSCDPGGFSMYSVNGYYISRHFCFYLALIGVCYING